jgi:DNA-binding response OmpR family regulator
MAALLIVEDDDDIRSDLTAILQVKGFDVRSAANGADALELLRSEPEPPCLIILDLMMPVMNGWELHAALREDPAYADVPVAVVSGAGSIDEKTAALDVAAVLSKPFELQHLIELVRRYCEPSS